MISKIILRPSGLGSTDSIDLPLKSKVSLFAQTAIAMETQENGITVKLRVKL